MRHYYGDDGLLAFDFDESHNEILSSLAVALNGLDLDFSGQRWAVGEYVVELVLKYDVLRAVDGDRLLAWRDVVEDDVLRGVLKRLFFDFVDRGFLFKEFYFAANAAVCRLQVDSILRGV